MNRTLMASALAMVLAIGTGAATPARAGSDQDVAKVVIGALTLFAIGAAVHNSRNDQASKRTSPSVARKPSSQPSHINRWNTAPNRPSRALPLIPAICAAPAGRNHGAQVARYLNEGCLTRNMRGARALPQRCARMLQTRRGKDRFYETACLKNAGYRLEARRR